MAYENGWVDRIRMDKWLWAARFFKTRSIAARACELGRIVEGDQPVKASREVKVGSLLRVKSDAGEFEVEVLLVSGQRGPAAMAQTLYAETDASREARAQAMEQKKAMKLLDPVPEGRPSKRDRREIERFRGRG